MVGICAKSSACPTLSEFPNLPLAGHGGDEFGGMRHHSEYFAHTRHRLCLGLDISRHNPPAVDRTRAFDATPAHTLAVARALLSQVPIEMCPVVLAGRNSCSAFVAPVFRSCSCFVRGYLLDVVLSNVV